ncbi:helix-turn-helix domain-containing protein [Burkholderia gladioli]|uniref:helix-turn-helix domain-containing protein n=1 Tax=Burkholderia gladioli TaxID=28095 RepID=UPI001C5F98AD|nr:helix-turn-helix domain-containing protein [Burkholderia gladioli]MBW5284212.1 replication protein O [Burkholderia gladioli]
MSIAQREVAGEDGAHPDALERENRTSVDLTCNVRNLPYQTLRAHQRALSVIGLPQRARCALAALAQTVDRRKPLASIFAHRDYLAARAGLSERTWYRAEHDLVDAGLITIADQTRKPRHARFGAAYIYLTETAATLLGLLGREATLGKRASSGPEQPLASDAAADADEATPAATVKPSAHDSHRSQERSLDTDRTYSHASPSARLADPYTNAYRSPASFQKRQHARLPSDVQPLLSLGFHENYIFKLMKLARVEHQKRLGDVVEACWESLKKAKRPIPYLRTLLRSPTDFAWLASQRRATITALAKARQEQLDLERAGAEIAGVTFVSRGGNVQYRVSGDGQMLTSYDVREGRERVATSGWLAGFVQAIRDAAVLRVRAGSDDGPRGTVARDPDQSRAVGSSSSVASVAEMRARLRATSGGQRVPRAVA